MTLPWVQALRWRSSPTLVVIGIGVVLSLPMLGAFGLVDPWETHYAEVAREMIERRDFVSPWWANDGFFMSKPILVMWLEAASMLLFGVKTGPNEVLAGNAHPEWAVRFPHFMLAIVGAALLAHGIGRACGRRAGLLSGVVLWTMPGYALLSHQAITDMPLVAGIAGALGLALRALTTNDLAVTRAFTVGPFELHAGHGLAAMIALVTVPQLLLLASLNVHGLHLGPDRLFAGSPHACGLPSQPACVAVAIAHPRLAPILQATFWLPGVVIVVAHVAGERRVARLCALGAWFFSAFGAMAKGPAGLVVPAAAILVHLVLTWRPRELLRLEILVGLALAAVMIGPWYLAVYARHGRHFLDELVLRHMLGRTLGHLHDTNEGEDTGVVYFVRQLGYATFPWCGFALAGLFARVHRSRRAVARSLFSCAAIVAFTLVSSMQTKFHHYGLLVLPPLAALAGIGLDAILSIASSPKPARSRRLHARNLLVVAAMAAGLVGLDLVRDPRHFVQLLSYRYDRLWVGTAGFARVFAVAAASFVLFAAGAAYDRWRKAFLLAFAAGALAFSGILLDLYLPRCAVDGGQRAAIRAYYADRAPRSDVRLPLVAYQLNWKGENFYTGNDVAIFISSGEPFRKYLEQAKGTAVYFVTERRRVAALQREIGGARSFTELTPREVSAEFSVVRAEL